MVRVKKMVEPGSIGGHRRSAFLGVSCGWWRSATGIAQLADPLPFQAEFGPQQAGDRTGQLVCQLVDLTLGQGPGIEIDGVYVGGASSRSACEGSGRWGGSVAEYGAGAARRRRRRRGG